MYKTLSAPCTVQIEVTGQCPNRCVHCYNYWRHAGSPKNSEGAHRLSIIQADRIMDELERAKVFYVIATGGEPLLNKPAVYRILDRAEQSRFMAASVNSTLIGLNEEDAKRLRGYKCLKGLLVSIMGPTAEIHDRIAERQGAFDLTIKGVQLLRRYGIGVAVNMVVSQLNQAYILETARLAKNLGTYSFNVTRAACPANCPDFSAYSLGLNEFRQYLRDFSNAQREINTPGGALIVYPLCAVRDVEEYEMVIGKRCSAGLVAAAISSTGEVRACTHLGFGYGNVLLESLPDIWKKMGEWRDGSLLPRVCKVCPALPVCGGGCRAEAQMTNGSLFATDPLISPRDASQAMKEYQELARAYSGDCPKLPKAVQLNPNVRWRHESFGSVVFVDGRSACFLNEHATDFLFGSSSTLYSPMKIGELTSTMPESFVSMLVKKMVLIPTEV